MNCLLSRALSVALPPIVEGRFWIIDLKNVQKDEIEDASKILNHDDWARINRFVFEKDRQRTTLVCATLKMLIGILLEKEACEISFLRHPLGKPYLEGHPLHFSLSYSKDYAFAGIHTTKAIGVDIEKIEETSLLEALDCFLHPSEKEWLLNSCSNPEEEAYTFWCAKEAVLKARGIGFTSDVLPLLQPLSLPHDKTKRFMSGGDKVYVYSGILQGHRLAVSVV